MEVVPIVLISLAVGGGLVGVIVWAHKREQKRLATWRLVAQQRGGQFLEPSGSFWKRKPHRIEVDVGEARVLCDTYVVSTGKSSTTYTRFRACYPLAAGPVFKVYKEGVLSSLGKALGTQDVTLGDDPEFDRVFMVKCDDAVSTRFAWTPEAKRLMLTSLQNCNVRSDGNEICLVGLGSWMDQALIEDAIDLVGTLANADLFGLTTLRALPGGTYQGTSGDWSARSPAVCAVVIQTTRVRFEPVIQHAGRPGMRASVSLTRDLPQCSVSFDPAGNPQGTIPQGIMPADSAALLPALGNTTLVTHAGLATITWHIANAPQESLMAGARLLAALAGGGQVGVFR